MIDCAVSCLRTYSPKELEELIQYSAINKGDWDYAWEIGHIRSRGIFRITYVIGCPVPSVNHPPR